MIVVLNAFIAEDVEEGIKTKEALQHALDDAGVGQLNDVLRGNFTLRIFHKIGRRKLADFALLFEQFSLKLLLPDVLTETASVKLIFYINGVVFKPAYQAVHFRSVSALHGCHKNCVENLHAFWKGEQFQNWANERTKALRPEGKRRKKVEGGPAVEVLREGHGGLESAKLTPAELVLQVKIGRVGVRTAGTSKRQVNQICLPPVFHFFTGVCVCVSSTGQGLRWTSRRSKRHSRI